MMRSSLALAILLALLWSSPRSWAQRAAPEEIPSVLAPWDALPLERVAIGVTRAGTPIAGFLPQDDPGVLGESRRLVVVSGLDGQAGSIDAAVQLARQFGAADSASPWSIAWVPVARPDAYRLPLSAAAGDPKGDAVGELQSVFPPPEDAYLSETAAEAQYLWRWLAIHGADAVVELRVGDQPLWHGVDTPNELSDGELAAALSTHKVGQIGRIPAWRLNVSAGEPIDSSEFLATLQRLVPAGPSPARAELQSRARRAPLEVARQLATHYGHTLNPVEYLQGTAVLGRLRLSGLTGDETLRADVRKITDQWLGKQTVDESSSGSVFAGHLVFAELARTTGEQGYIELVKQVAERGFDASGEMRQAMPAHNEMSDAVFMSTPMLVEAGRLTGETKYYEMALKHLQFMLDLNLRPDGLHRHSPLDETAWGRGNGFPALGLAWCLDRIPADRAEREVMLAAFQAHLAALRPHQDVTGMWHQVVDHPESYRELTATCMITYAMLRGVQQGWLDDSYVPAIEAAWSAVKLRIGDDGVLFDVCTGTGKQQSLRAYYDRPAILGRDNRGGAMSLLLATEYASYHQ